MGARHDRFLLGLGILPCAAVSIAAPFAIPSLRTALVGAGMPLPLVTKAMFATYPYWGVTVVAVALLWRLWPDAASRDRVACAFGSSCAIALLVFGAWGWIAPLVAWAGSR